MKAAGVKKDFIFEITSGLTATVRLNWFTEFFYELNFKLFSVRDIDHTVEHFLLVPFRGDSLMLMSK